MDVSGMSIGRRADGGCIFFPLCPFPDQMEMNGEWAVREADVVSRTLVLSGHSLPMACNLGLKGGIPHLAN
jgi:hypothetical protein